MSQILTIDRMGGQGDGIADTPNGAVFAFLTLPGEVIAAEVVEGRVSDFSLVTPSDERIDPTCDHFGTCGGCALQHWAMTPYLEYKRDQVRLALEREGIETEIMPTIAVPSGSRRRLALHARRLADGRVVLGFKARKSWRLVEITECSVAHPRLVAALPVLKTLAAAFLEHPKSAPTLHVSWTLSGMDVDVTGVERKSGGLSGDRQVQAIRAAQAGDLARLSLAGETLVMARQPRVMFGSATVPLPAGGFLQAVEAAETAMAQQAVAAIDGVKKVADLFCGTGTFTFPLATKAAVLAADSSVSGIMALKAGIGSVKGMRQITAEARDLFRRPLTSHDLKGCEAVVFDPPRAGALEQCRQIADAKGIGIAVGISCNPATFARDARVLIDAGFKLERVTPVDQFLWSSHVELVGVFRR